MCEECYGHMDDPMDPDLDLLDKTMDKIDTIVAFQNEGLYQDIGWHQGSWGINFAEMVKKSEAQIKEALRRVERAADDADVQRWIEATAVNREGLRLWQQKAESCGTAFCFAGHIANDDSEVKFVGGYQGFDYVMPVGGDFNDSISTSEYAQKKLGLNEYWANKLFNGSNTLDDLHRIVQEIHEAAGGD